MAPGEGGEPFLWDGGRGDFGFDPKDAVSSEVTLEMLEVPGGWLVDDKPTVARVLLTPFSFSVLLRGEILMALVRTWLKMVTVCTVGIVGCGEGKIKSVAEGKSWEAPSRKVSQEGTEQELPVVLVTTSKSTPGPLDLLAGMADVTTQGAVAARLWKRWVESELSEGEGWLVDTGAVSDIVASGSILPKTGLKVGLEIPGAVEREELEDTSAVTDILE